MKVRHRDGHSVIHLVLGPVDVAIDKSCLLAAQVDVPTVRKRPPPIFPESASAILARVTSIDYSDRRRQLLANVAEWAGSEQNIRVAILTGSAAREADDSDALSDLDIELYVEDPAALLSERSWYRRFGRVLAVEELPNPGWHPTRLLYLQGGKIDFMIASWAALPGTRYERVYRVLVDKDSLTVDLPPPERTDVAPPTPEAFDTCVNWFSAAAIMSARCIARGDPWAAKFRDWDLKVELLKMIEWDHRARYGWDYDTWFNAKHLDLWVDAEIRSALDSCWAGFSPADATLALLASNDLFVRLAERTAPAVGAAWVESSAVCREVETILAMGGFGGPDVSSDAPSV